MTKLIGEPTGGHFRLPNKRVRKGVFLPTELWTQPPKRKPLPIKKRYELLRDHDLLDDVKAAIAPFHVTVFDVLGRVSCGSIRSARRAACVVLYRLGKSLPEIGVYFGRDHTTIMCMLETEGVARRKTSTGKAA